MSQANCHIAVTAEIEINLQHISNCSNPCGKNIQFSCTSRKQCICCKRHGIRNQNFFGKADDKSPQTFRNFFHIRISVVNLFLYIVILYNGPSNELREKGNIKHHIPQIFLRLHFSAVNINDKG